MMLVLSEKIGRGKEKACYVHPLDSCKAVKVPVGKVRVQINREIRFYQKLSKRAQVSYSHMPRFYGEVETNLGHGYVVDLVRDYDGNISESLQWYLKNGFRLDDFTEQLQEFKKYFLENRIIFSDDIINGNILVKKISAEQKKLVIIDGIGDVTFIQWLNNFDAFVRRKIERRWARFWLRLLSDKEL